MNVNFFLSESWGLFPLHLTQDGFVIALTNRLSVEVTLCVIPAQAATDLAFPGFIFLEDSPEATM